jgi:hypothetical protein
VELAEIVSLTFSFHRVVYVSLTQKCPIRCRHCFVESSPTRSEHANLDAFRRWLDGILETESVELITFSGGEPLSHPRALAYGLKACLDSNRYSVLATSAFWARTPTSADETLDRYPPFRCLWISTDCYHEEFVPLSHLRNAAEAAIKRNISVVFQIVDDDPNHSPFLKRFESQMGELAPKSEVFITPLSLVGRASRELDIPLPLPERDLSKIPDVPCPWLGAPWLHEDGVVCACPNLEVHRNPHHPLRLGDLNVTNFSVISRRADNDLYLQAIRVLGPRGIVETFSVEEWGWDRASFRGTNICDLCHSLAAVPNLPRRVQESAPLRNVSSRIDALRVVLYAETLHLLSRARAGAAHNQDR